MPGWHDQNGWMAFPYLDGGHGLNGAYTLAYKITDDPGEAWSERFIRFKDKMKRALWGVAYVVRVAVPDLFAGLGLVPAETVIVAALSSGETIANPKRAVPLLAQTVANKTGAIMNLDAITKKVHRRIHDLGGAAARDEELDKAEYRSARIAARNIVIFDDFITRGGTLSRIAQAVRATSGNVNVFGVALGKTERRGWVPDLSNAHVPEKWSKLWLEGEQAFRDHAQE